MSGRTAIVFGGTGLVGRSLIDELIKNDNYGIIRVFTRNKVSYPGVQKVMNSTVDFEHPESFSEQIKGDDLYICLGTTMKKAGSVKKMEEIDRELSVTLSKSARDNGVKRVAVVSSIGADRSSSSYYLRIKGEMEQQIMDIDFETIAIVRPSLLLGERNERRFGESAGKIIMKILGIFLFGKFRKYRAIKAVDVAFAMIRILQEAKGINIYKSDQLQTIADHK